MYRRLLKYLPHIRVFARWGYEPLPNPEGWLALQVRDTDTLLEDSL